MSCLDNAINTAIPTTMLLDMMNLYRFSGKDSYYNSLFKKDLNAFRNVNIQEEVIAFAQIMRLDLTTERLKLFRKAPQVGDILTVDDEAFASMPINERIFGVLLDGVIPVEEEDEEQY